jgi:hypothetical protein
MADDVPGTPQQTGPDPPPTTPPWKTLLELVSALAGVALIFYFVGALLLAARLWALGLPLGSTLALLPKQTLAVAGGRALLPGLAALALLLLILRFSSVTAESSPVKQPVLRTTTAPLPSLSAPFRWIANMSDTIRGLAAAIARRLTASWRRNAWRSAAVLAEVLVAVIATGVGVRIATLLPRIGLGFVATLAAALAAAHAAAWHPERRIGSLRKALLGRHARRMLGGLVFALLLVGVPVAFALFQPQSRLTLVLSCILALAGISIARLLFRMGRSRPQAYGLLLLVLVLGTALQIVHAAAPPTRLDFGLSRHGCGHGHGE